MTIILTKYDEHHPSQHEIFDANILCDQWLDSNLHDDLNLEMWGIWQPGSGGEGYTTDLYPWNS